MRRGARKTASQRLSAPVPGVRPGAIGGWLPARGPARIGLAVALVAGVGTLAVAVGAEPEEAGARWLGSIDAGQGGKALRLVHAAALGLDAELRRVEAERDSQVQGLRAELRTLGAQQAVLQRRLWSIDGHDLEDLKPAPAGVSTVAATQPVAPGLEEEVVRLRLVAAGLLLREAARSGSPFEPALERFSIAAAAIRSSDLVAERVAMTESIEALRPHATSGVTPVRDLRRSFASLAVMAQHAAPSGWWDSALVMVGLRDDPLQPLQDARAALMVDDLEGAVAALATLRGEAALVSEDWLGLAQARLATDAAVDHLYRLALAVGAEPLVADGPVASSGEAAPTPRKLSRSLVWQSAQTTPAEVARQR